MRERERDVIDDEGVRVFSLSLLSLYALYSLSPFSLFYLGPIVLPVAQDGDAQLGPPPPGLWVGVEPHSVDGRLVAVDVDVQLVVRNGGAAPARGPHLDRQARAHFGPDQRHLGAQPELAAGLADAVLGPGQDPAQQVWDGRVRHADAVVLDGQPVERFGAPPPVGRPPRLQPLALRVHRAFAPLLAGGGQGAIHFAGLLGLPFLDT